MPKPIVCLSEQLRQYLENFRNCFSKRQWKYFVTVLLGLITCHDLDKPLKSIRYWGSIVLDLDAQSLVDILAVRWEIETFFEYEKDLLGSDHNQVMTAHAVVRFRTLIAWLMCFLEEQRTTVPEQQLTCGDVRRLIQHEHRMNLLSWLEERFKEGCSVEQIRGQLALSNS